MEEFLVIFACLNSTGCTETSRHYYNTHPQIQEVVKKGEKIANKYIGPTAIQVLGPAILISAGATGTIRLNKHFSLQGNKNTGILGFSKEF